MFRRLNFLSKWTKTAIQAKQFCSQPKSEKEGVEKNQEKVVISNKKRMEIPSVVFLLMSRAVIFPQLKHPVFGIIP